MGIWNQVIAIAVKAKKREISKEVQMKELTKNEMQGNKEMQYKSLVNQLIRKKYSLNEEFAILRQQDSKSEEYREYFDYCEECKAKAKSELQ